LYDRVIKGGTIVDGSGAAAFTGDVAIQGGKIVEILIDFTHLKMNQPFMASDLPTGADRLMQTAEGYVATLVSGEVVQREGKETGARPGKLVRSGIK
jgi:N-acyl-D-amino-acid deacylase